ncbi:conserved hypothetical protein [Leishmania mexicana MHOM/GT/2001/U1103]|uniref:Abnormal spindle-like microcephaly-associated protein ASH domain-containing protein n=1 Tax=Leishmania mexicana (strain MHOM/GT/2001/U1103) TaxID=929439 RepID=E9AJM0_LEIMU|nr:conserved hypothetical protein [Leishmania mexicana MHOM/GT/2001/U1103]CBZ23119.1 conserved hypothetical protein [Leishmania mexicana MHOM/GT/2001/U1103]
MLDISCESILFDDVAVNDIPAYRPVQVRNTSGSPLLVKLTTTSPVVQIQLCNENYEAIKRVGFADTLSVYSEAFDLVGLISSIELAPFEEKDLVVWFRADAAMFSHLVKGSQPVPYTGSLQLTVANPAPASHLGNAPKVDGEKRVGAQQPAAACITIPFRANVYVSCLKLSSTELHITMAPNKTQVTDFVVTNMSCQPVYFAIRDQAMPLRGLDVALYESDKFEEPKLGHRLLLDSYAYMTFSLILRSSTASSTAQQQYHTVFQCDNLRDNRNTTLLYVSVNVVAESQGDLVAFHDTSVNFGDVYRGTKAMATIRAQSLDDREEAVLRLGDVDRRKCEGKVSLMKGNAAVDEMTIGSQKGNQLNTVTLMYQPFYDGDSKDESKIKFDVELLVVSADRGHSQRVVIRCAAVLYTSNIVVSQRSVNFGDCQVGQSKRFTLQIENRSPLPGQIVVQLRSKIIRIEGVSTPQKLAGRELKEEFSVAPSASLPITLRITPQRVNPMYRKQLTIINASNPAEDRQVINIEANNMAPLDAKLHDELYSWKCDLGNIDSTNSRRGPSTLWAISGVPLIVPYSVQSKVDYKVVLNLCSSCPEIEVFYSSDAVVCDQLGTIAAEMRSFCVYGESEDASHLTNEAAEQLFTAREELLRLLNETSHSITNRITLEPLVSIKAYVLIIRTASPTEPLTKEDGISIAVDGIEAPRFVRLSYRLCGTSFELNGQKTKNFGEVNIGVKKTTKLPIVNRCNSFLYLHLSKSRSVTAEHIRMENSDKRSIFLTIRPYASREIELTLYPGIKGVFQEKIRVSNILNIKNTITMTLKATVIKADTFEISPDSWTFEMLVPSSSSVPALMASSPPFLKAEDATAAGNARVGAKFTVSNTSNARRQIVVRLDLNSTAAANGVSAANPYLSFAGVKVAVQLDMMLSGATSVSARKLEEQIEKLEQKLKIYVRKNKTEKAESAMRKIEAYRLALKGEEVDLTALEAAQSGIQSATDHELSESEDDSSGAALQVWRNKTQQGDIVQLLRREGVALPSMDTGESVIITLFLVCKRFVEESIPVSQTQTMNLLFYEARDQEANRIIPIDLILLRTPGDAATQQLLAVPSVGATSQTVLPLPAAASAVVVPSASPSLPSPLHQDSESLQVSPDNATVVSAFPSAGALQSGGALPGSSGAASRALQSRPPPCIRLLTAGSHPGHSDGCPQATFMGHPLIVLRNCIVNDQTEFSFMVKANTNTTIVVLEPRRCGGSVAAVLDARFKLFPRNGHVRQQEPLRIVVECTARSVGPQKYFIPVKNICNAADVQYLTVEMNPTEETEMLTTEPKELLFRDVITPCAASQLETQLVLIRCRFSFPHALIVRTNKPSQLALFEDASCTVPLLHPIRHIFVKETVRVYVQLRPGARYVDPCARQIRAGVLVEAVAPNPVVSSTAYCVVGKAILRAMACVGSGLFEVPQGSLDLGCVAPTQDYVRTHFTVRNTSHTFALRVALVPSSPLLEVAEETSAGNEIVVAPLQEHMVPILVHLPAPGLTREFVDVMNCSSSQEPMRVSLSALRMNDGIVQVDPPANTRLAFPVAAVVRGEQGRQLHLHQPVSYSVTLANHHSHREVVLATTTAVHASCALPLWFHTPDEESKVRAAFEEEQRHALEAADDSPTSTPGQTSEPRAGTVAPTTTPVADQPPAMYTRGRVELKANHTQIVTWTLTSLPMLTSEEVAAVLQYQMVTITTTLQVYVTYTAHSARAGAAAGGWQPYSSGAMSQGGWYRGPTAGQCVLLVPITLSLAMSEGRAEPAVVSLGLVGKATSMPTSPSSSASSVSLSNEEHDAAPEHGFDAFASGREEEMVLAARQRRRRRLCVSKLRRPRNHTFSAFASKSGLQPSSSHNMVVSFRLINLSAVIPLPLKVECPPVVRFSQTRLTIPPGESTVVQAALNMKLIATQGTFRYEAFFVNEWNPENDIAVCITGQYYWKVFQVLRADTQEEVRESLTLAPLRVEPSLRVPLAEMKLNFVATEPDVEFDMHLQSNPQLDGLLELLLLHYDATSAVRHLSFRSDIMTPTSPAATSVAGGVAAASVVQGSAGAAVAGMTSLTASVTGPPASCSTIAVAAAGAGAGLGGGPATSGSANPSIGPPSGGTPGNLQPGTPSGVAATATATGFPALSATSAVLPVDEFFGATGTTPTGIASGASIAAAAEIKARPRKTGASSTAGTVSTANGGAAAAATPSQTLRLRCLLRSGDLSSLVSLFYGYRKARAAGTSAQMTTATTSTKGTGAGVATTSSTVAAPLAPPDITASETAGGSCNAGAVTWTYDRIAELERRNASLASNNVWLGTVVVENPFTEAEEVQVYSTLAPFRTFSAPSKVMLRPCRVSVESVRRPSARATATQASTHRGTPQVGYVGEISITNEFDVYVAELSVVVLVHERLAVPLHIDVRGGCRYAVDTVSPDAAAGATPSLPDAALEDEEGTETDIRPTSTFSASPRPGVPVATSFLTEPAADGARPVSLPHCIHLAPHETVVVTVAIRPVDVRTLGPTPMSPTTAVPTALPTPLSLPSLEEFVSVVLVDENAPFSYVVSRVSIVTPTSGAEALPNMVLSSVTTTSNRAAAATSVAAASGASTKDGEAEARPSAALPPAAHRDDLTRPLVTPSATLSGEGPTMVLTTSTTLEEAPQQLSLSRNKQVPDLAFAGGTAAAAETGETEAAPEAEVLLPPRGSTPCDSEGAAEGLLVSLAGAITTLAPSLAAAPRQWVLSLRNCHALPGCGGAYLFNFSVPRDDTYEPNILITNNAPDRMVRYTVQAISQSPQVWLLLTTTTGVLEAGETQPLRLQVLSSEVGSFVGYVAITNTFDAREVVYLRLNAEVFVPGTAEGFFDVVAMSDDHRLATTNAGHSVYMGALYGAGTSRALMALEIVNKGSVALEFPVSVVHPMRQELRPIPQSVWYGTAVSASGHRRRHVASGILPQRIAVNDDGSAAPLTLPRSSRAALDQQVDPTAVGAATGTVATQKGAADGSVRTAGGIEEALYTTQPFGQPKPLLSPHHPSLHYQRSGVRPGTGVAAVPTSTALSSTASTSASPFEGKLIVCQIHGVPTRTGQRYFVVDPRSRMRLAFVLSCNALHDIPEGYGVFGQTDVVFRCKQARDARFSFNVKFEAYRPTFAVALEYDMDAAEGSAASTGAVAALRSEAVLSSGDALEAVDGSAPAKASAAPFLSSSLPPASAATSRWAEVPVAVTNLSRSHTQVFVLYTQSEVLSLSVPGAGATAHSVCAGSTLLPPLSGAAAEDDGYGAVAAAGSSGGPAFAPSGVEIGVGPQSVGVFTVRLDRLRAEALLKFDKDESMLARPALCEHAFLYNKGNPRERVQLLFRQQALLAQPQRQARAAAGGSLAVEPVSAKLADAKPVKGGGQHFRERNILGFAQRFSAVMTSLTDRVPFLTRPEDMAESVRSHRSAGGSSSTGVGGGGGGSGAASTTGGDGVGSVANAGAAVVRVSAGTAAFTVAGVTSSVASSSFHGKHRPTGRNQRSRRDRDSGPVAHRGNTHRSRQGDSFRDDTSDGGTASGSSGTTTTTTTTSSYSSDVADSDDFASEIAEVAADRTLDSPLTEDNFDQPSRDGCNDASDIAVGEAIRESGESATTGCPIEVHNSSDGTSGDLASHALFRSSFHPCMRSSEGPISSVAASSFSSLLPLGTPLARSSSVGSHPSNEDLHWYDTLITLHDLLVELTWLCDELLFYGILLRNSRHVEACMAFLIAAVTQHPVMVAWRRRRGSTGRSRKYDIFGQFLETLDALPRLSSTSSSSSS